MEIEKEDLGNKERGRIVIGYLELVTKYTMICNEIGYIETQMKTDIDKAFERKLKRLRVEQIEIKKQIDRYNGVDNDDR